MEKWKSYFLGKKSEENNQKSPVRRKHARKSPRRAATGPHTISMPLASTSPRTAPRAHQTMTRLIGEVHPVLGAGPLKPVTSHDTDHGGKGEAGQGHQINRDSEFMG